MPDDDLTPESLESPDFPVARRGYDRTVVDEFLRRAARDWSELRDRHESLVAEVGRADDIELFKADLAAMGQEIGDMLQASRTAAEGIRERATAEATAKVDRAERRAAQILEEAASAAEAIRGSVWEEGIAVMAQVESERDDGIQKTKSDVLLIRAEAEQASHKMQITAKREAEEIVRGARYEADRIIAEARSDSEAVMGAARRDAEVAQQRAHALGELGRDLHDEGGPGIRVIPSTRAPRPEVDAGLNPHNPEYGDALAAEVEALRAIAPPVEDELPQPVEEDYPDELGEPAVIVDEPEPAPDAEAPVEPVEEPSSSGTVESDSELSEEDRDRVDDLFAALRADGTTVEPASLRTEPKAEKSGADPVSEPPAEPVSAVVITVEEDPVAVRDELLLPVQNAALREIKRRIREVQNVGLDALRASGDWEPDMARIGAELRAGLEGSVRQAAEAGARAAERFGAEAASGTAGERALALVGDMATELAARLRSTLEGTSGQGQKARQAALSRVFRAWRTDESERWVRTIASAAYHDTLVAALGVVSVTGVRHGRLCADCPAGLADVWVAAEGPPPDTVVPPARVDCTCTIAPARRV